MPFILIAKHSFRIKSCRYDLLYNDISTVLQEVYWSSIERLRWWQWKFVGTDDSETLKRWQMSLTWFCQWTYQSSSSVILEDALFSLNLDTLCCSYKTAKKAIETTTTTNYIRDTRNQ
jgi:hypothetical protein